ncbi:NUDIX domain-containing protein [Desulfobacter latus]|uniref:GDP-mannose pyrophosphatase n=1 Tax=Desulfobacter latus TaxID=2292 RepID=A0A850TDN2_9BACT|nr:NUDIX hydrolase [Desulfobacter latus]NWH05546.1 NUDIX hydrolase [Desulfobacter latus]
MDIYKNEKLTDYPHLNLIRARYKDRTGTDKSWLYASRQNAARPDAVVIVPFHQQENKLVIIKEFRVPLDGYQYGFPAGLVDAGETIVQAGRRELYEETGLTVVDVIKQSPAIFSSSGLTDESISLLYVACDGSANTEYNEASELIEVKMLSQEQASDCIRRDNILFDVKTWIILDRFAATGKMV